MSFWNAAASSLSAHFYRQKAAELKGSGGPENEVVDLIPGFSTAVQLGDLPDGILFGNLESQFDEFSCSSWLNSQKPRSVAYISFGTVCRLQPHEIVALAETFEETKTKYLWVIDNESKKHFPDGFLERTTASGVGKVVPWAPQVEVLDHLAVGVFVTHGGWNSVLESLGAGVPMICRPFFGDHKMISWMVERVWGIGVRIEGEILMKHGTRCALDKILSVDGSSKNKERIEVLKDVAHKAVGVNGSSSQNFQTLVDVVTCINMYA